MERRQNEFAHQAAVDQVPRNREVVTDKVHHRIAVALSA